MIYDLQWRRSKKLLDHAFANCPYYTDKWKADGIHPEDIKSFKDFRNIPLTTKRDIQVNLDRMVWKDIPFSELIRNHTGGSTGALTRNLVAKTPGIYQAQLVQEEKAKVTMRLIRAPEFSEENEGLFIKTAKMFLGDEIVIELDYVDEIPQTSSGKNLFCISHVNPFE